MENEEILKVFVLVTLAVALIGQAFSDFVNNILWVIIFPSLLLSWIIGLIIEEFGFDLNEDYYYTIELDGFRLSGTISLATLVIFIIRVIIF